MTRTPPLTALLLSTVALLAFSGCHTTVVEPAPQQPVAQPAPQPDHDHDRDHDRDQRQPPPPPPDHHDDRDHHDQQPQH